MKTTKHIITFFAALASTVAFCGLAELGGLHMKPGSQKGKVAIIDTQNSVASNAFVGVAAMFSKETKINFVYERAEQGDVQSLMDASKANVVLVIVDDDTTPAMLLAPEDYWGKMNVRKLLRNLKTDRAREKFYASRCAKESTRALSILCGGGSSQYPGNVMNAARFEDADAFTNGLPVDMIDAYVKYLGSLGVSPAIYAVYEKACMQGWAPPPTNDVQRAIWDETRQLPTKPIKIKFDPKKGK